MIENPAAVRYQIVVMCMIFGSAGLAAAAQLNKVGHEVTVYERADRIGGLLRYGIPEFKMEKRHIDRRLEQMAAEGTEFRANAVVGENVDINVLYASYDAIVLACGATQWRDLPVPGRELDNIRLRKSAGQQPLLDVTGQHHLLRHPPSAGRRSNDPQPAAGQPLDIRFNMSGYLRVSG